MSRRGKLNPAGLILVLIGSFSFAGGLFNWGWFMNTRRASVLVRVIGIKGARIFYMFLGISVFVFGFLITLNLISAS
jgi:hypothetical protein